MLVVLQWGSNSALACSAFSTTGKLAPLFAKSYDWEVGHGQLVINKRNVQKSALTITSGATGARWTSAFGSLTFNQHGREFPLGGINERGLAVEILWLPSTKFPDPKSAPSVNEAQWIQYHLDRAGTLREMIQMAKQVVIAPIFAKTHYMACDATGACASFEYLNGQLEIVEMTETVLTNSSYQDSREHLKNFQGFGGSQRIPMTGYTSLDRFVRIASLKKALSNVSAPEERNTQAFEILSSVRSQSHSKWQITYDLALNKVTFRKLDQPQSSLKTVDFKEFDFDCRSPVMTFDMNKAGRGDVTGSFDVYSKAENHRMVLKSAKALGLPERLAKVVSDYPNSTVCL